MNLNLDLNLLISQLVVSNRMSPSKGALLQIMLMRGYYDARLVNSSADISPAPNLEAAIARLLTYHKMKGVLSLNPPLLDLFNTTVHQEIKADALRFMMAIRKPSTPEEKIYALLIRATAMDVIPDTSGEDSSDAKEPPYDTASAGA